MNLTHEAGALVIYDEVITAFRFMYGGAQDLLGVKPDLTAMGKIIGGGLPIGAYGGKKRNYGTSCSTWTCISSWNNGWKPCFYASGIACLEVLQQEGVYEKLDQLGAMLEKGILEEAKKHNIPITVNRLKGALTVYFTTEQLKITSKLKIQMVKCSVRFFKLMLQEGVNLAPSKYEAWFLTTEHTEEDIEYTIEAVGRAFSTLANNK